MTKKKLWYYEKNYGTIPNTMKLWFTVEKTMVYGKYYGTMGKKLRYYGKTIVL